jgi:DNA-nicking Smr family endonuclease
MSRKPEPKPPATPAFRNESLKDQLAAWKKSAAPASPATPPKPSTSAPKPPPKPPAKAARAASTQDDQLFRWAMEEVSPLAQRPAERGTTAPSAAELAIVSDDAEALAQLSELVATGEGLDLADTDECMEGTVRGVDASLRVRLRRGDFGVQAQVDLHGLSSDAAKAEFERFLVESRRRGLRCVLVVHGRALPSKDPIRVLKEQMGPWLTRGRLSRIVLAFATARLADGGAGALYVLLRR